MFLLNRKHCTFDETFTFLVWRLQRNYGYFSELFRAFSAAFAIAPVHCPDMLTRSSHEQAAHTGLSRAADWAEAELSHCLACLLAHFAGTALALWPQYGDRTGHTLSPAGSVTEATFWILAGARSSFKLCCATCHPGQRDCVTSLTCTNTAKRAFLGLDTGI